MPPNFIRLLVCCLALFAGTLWLHTRHNDFAWFYHSDEPTKVEQLIGRRPLNFHHPLLLLNATRATMAVLGTPAEPQAVVEAGRLVAALCMAGAVVALALLAYALRGPCAGIAAGLVLATHHQLFELAHYLKEDPPMLLGMSLSLLAAMLHTRRPTFWSAVLLGAACGLAVGGKATGLIAVAIAAVPMVACKHGDRWRWTAYFALAALLVFAAASPQAFTNAAKFGENMNREAALAAGGQGMTQSVPHGHYWSIFLTNTTPVMWALLAVALFTGVRRWRAMSGFERVLLVFPFAYALALSFFPKENDRYFLPATAVLCVLAACAVPDAVALLRLPKKWAAPGLAMLLVAAQFPSWTEDRGGFARYFRAFQHDDTAELRDWLAANAQPGEPIARDSKVRLPDARRRGRQSPLPNPLLTEEYAADLGTLDELRAKGVAWVIISASTYGKFERSGFRPKKGGADDAERRRAFYAELRRSYEPVWSRPRGTVVYLHPGLEVYRIAE